MQKTGILLGICIVAFFSSCDSPTSESSDNSLDNPGPVLSPFSSILAGDTFAIEWTNPIAHPGIYYNFNDSSEDYNDALWHSFPDSQIISINTTSAQAYMKLDLYSVSNNFRIRVTDTLSESSSETGALNLDHIVLLKPAGNETYAIGQAVDIRFKRNKFMDRVYLHFMAGNGEDTDFSLTATDINFDERGLGAVSSVFDTVWTIGSESYSAGKSARYPGDSCYFYAFSYYLGTQFRGAPNSPGLNSDWNRIPFAIK